MKNRKTKKLKCREEGCDNIGEVGEDITARTCASCVQKNLSNLGTHCTEDGDPGIEPEDQ